VVGGKKTRTADFMLAGIFTSATGLRSVEERKLKVAVLEKQGYDSVIEPGEILIEISPAFAEVVSSVGSVALVSRHKKRQFTFCPS
jgi:hypothetical protein